MHARFEQTFDVAAGKDGNDFIGRVVTGVATVDLSADAAAEYPRGIVAHASEDSVGVVQSGVVEAYFGEAYDPATDTELLASDANGRLKAAGPLDWVCAEYFDGGAVSVAEAAAGTAIRRVIARPPTLLPAA